jgi:hypothetical protein
VRPISRTLARVAAAATLAAAAFAATPAGPAAAATCASADGVSVVVAFHELGGGVRTACVADGGGRSAASLFPAAGFPLTYAQRQPGFVCRVSGVPTSDPCVNTSPADAYWGLWWSDGKSGSWSYATTGAGGLTVPEGGYVAFSWNGSAGRNAPGATPSPHPAASPSSQPPTHTPTHAPTHTASGGPGPTSATGGPTGTASAEPDPSSTPSSSAAGETSKPGRSKPGHRGSSSPSPGASPSSRATAPADNPGDPDTTVPASSEAADPDGGLPAWVAPAAIVVLLGAAGGAAVVRRRRGTP